MNRQTGNWNRAGRRQGGDRHVVIGNRVATNAPDRLRVLIGTMVDSHPDWSLEQVANEAIALPGATVEKVALVLQDYLDD